MVRRRGRHGRRRAGSLGTPAALIGAWAIACAPGNEASLRPGGAELEPDAAELGAREISRTRAPIELRDRDGGVMPLRILELRGEVEGPLAFTELHLEFENGEAKAREGVLEMILPTRARLARFAIEHEGVWQDAEVEERRRIAAREGIHAKTPAAIDYGDRGQLFRVVVPEVRGRERVRMVVAYREMLADPHDPYRVYLEGLPELERLTARVRGDVGADQRETPKEGAVGADGVEFNHPHYRPVSDLVLRSPRQRTVAVQHEGLVAARIRPLTHDHHDPLRSLTVLFDTSASRAPAFERGVARLSTMLDELERWTGPDTRIHLVAFDQSHETIYEGPLSGLEATHFDALRERRALGASDLGAALRHLIYRPGHRYDRLLLVTDGVVTAGSRDLDRLEAAVQELGSQGLRRLDVLEDGGFRDHSTLRRLTRVLPRPGIVLDPREHDRNLVHRMVRGVVTDVSIDVPGASWVYPGEVEGVQAGDELMVFAEFPEALSERELVVEVDGEISAKHVISWQATAGPLLETAIAEAHVQDLSDALYDSRDQPTAVRRKAYRKIVELSREHRLLNDFTRFSMPLRDPEDPVLLASTAPPTLVMGPRHAEARAPVSVASATEPARFLRRYLTVDRLALVLAIDTQSEGVEASTVDRPSARPARMPDPPPRIVDAEQSEELETLARVEPVDFVGALRHDLQRETAGRFEGESVERRVPRTARRHWSTWTRQVEVAGPRRVPSDAHEGNLLAVMNLLAWGETHQAARYAEAWRGRDPADPLALVALGEAYEAQARPDAATRAYGSLIDLYPHRPDVRRFAGTRLEGLGAAADDLAIDTFRRALDQDPDSPVSHRSLALALLRRGRFERAFDVLEAALQRQFDAARHGGRAAEGLREDLGLVAAAWLRSEAHRRTELVERLQSSGARLPSGPSVRVALSWETPDGDADLHVRDGRGHHAYHGSPHLPGGGRIVEDVTAGFGVERFVDEGRPEGAYELQVHYYSLGPLGYGMGRVEILSHDGAGGLDFELRPFVVSRERADVDLGEWPMAAPAERRATPSEASPLAGGPADNDG